jgi:hypothetical protein
MALEVVEFDRSAVQSLSLVEEAEQFSEHDDTEFHSFPAHRFP